MSSRIFSTFILILLAIQVGQSQKLAEFSTNKLEFYKQLEKYMTASKKKSMEEVVENFGGQFQAGFSEEQQDTIIATCNRMLKLKMSANTYFKNYLISLTHIKNLAGSKRRFSEWHEVINGMLKNIKSRKIKPVGEFFEFSKPLVKMTLY